MRWSEIGRQRKMKNRVARASGLAVEALESRALLNATLSSPINGVSATTTVDLSQHFNDPNVPGTLVDIITQQGTIPVALTDAKTPKTVANFLSYITNGEYQGTIVHRLAQNFVIQGGGYNTAGQHITQQSPVQSEAGASNVVGTIAMALSTGPNSGTSEWFINLANNSSSLDGSSNGGPFTVFGNVVYKGMDTVNSIASLPVIDGSSVNNAWNTLPVLNQSAGTAPTNLVSTSYQVVPALTYTATTDDPSVATATVSGSQLSVNVLNPNASTQVHVTATDAGGNTATTTFGAGKGAGVTTVSVTVGTKGVQVVRFNDAGGTQGNVSLSGGKGTATVTLTGTNLVQLPGKNQVVQVRGSVTSTAIGVTGTTPTSVLTVWGKGGNGVVHLSSITNDAAMAMLNAPHAALSGPLTETGAIGKVVIGNVSNGTVTIGAGKTADMNVETMNNVQINSFITLNRFNVDTWTGTAGISATSLNHININHSFSGTVSATRVKSFTAGSIVGGTWTVAGNVHELKTSSISNLNFTAQTIANLRVNGTVSSSTLRSSTNISSIKAGGLTSSNVYAGTDNLTTGFPTATSDFTAQGLLKSIVVNHFVNSNIGAQRADTVTLAGVQTSNNGTPFGVGTQRIKNLSLSVGKKHVHVHNVTSTAQVTNAFSKSNITPQDLRVNIV